MLKSAAPGSKGRRRMKKENNTRHRHTHTGLHCVALLFFWSHCYVYFWWTLIKLSMALSVCASVTICWRAGVSLFLHCCWLLSIHAILLLSSILKKKTPNEIKESREMLLESFNNQTYNRIKRNAQSESVRLWSAHAALLMCSTKAKWIFVDFEYFVLKSHKKRVMLRVHEIKSNLNDFDRLECALLNINCFLSNVTFQAATLMAMVRAAVEVSGITNWHKTMGHDGRHLKSHSHPFAASNTVQLHILSIKCRFNDAF